MSNAISTPNAPAPGGHYSQAMRAGGSLYVSGMLPGPCLPGQIEGFERQARAALGHCQHVIEAAGYAMNDVVQCTVYVAGVEYWAEFNKIYASVFGEHRPARAVVPVPMLHHDYLVEIQMVAFRD